MTPLLGPTELQAHVQVMSQRRREALALAYRGECGPGTANDRFWPVRDKTISDPGCVETVDTVVGKARNKAFVEFGDFGAATPIKRRSRGYAACCSSMRATEA